MFLVFVFSCGLLVVVVGLWVFFLFFLVGVCTICGPPTATIVVCV